MPSGDVRRANPQCCAYRCAAASVPLESVPTDALESVPTHALPQFPCHTSMLLPRRYHRAGLQVLKRKVK